jgi:hypothetical protein
MLLEDANPFEGSAIGWKMDVFGRGDYLIHARGLAERTRWGIYEWGEGL